MTDDKPTWWHTLILDEESELNEDMIKYLKPPTIEFNKSPRKTPGRWDLPGLSELIRAREYTPARELISRHRAGGTVRWHEVSGHPDEELLKDAGVCQEDVVDAITLHLGGAMSHFGRSAALIGTLRHTALQEELSRQRAAATFRPLQTRQHQWRNPVLEERLEAQQTSRGERKQLSRQQAQKRKAKRKAARKARRKR